MKKAIVGLLLVVCLLTACSKEVKPEGTTEDPQLAVTTTATTEISTDSVEAEILTTEEQPSTALETSEIATEVTQLQLLRKRKRDAHRDLPELYLQRDHRA